MSFAGLLAILLDISIEVAEMMIIEYGITIIIEEIIDWFADL